MIAQRGSFWTQTLRGQQRAEPTISSDVDESVMNDAPIGAAEAQQPLIRSNDHGDNATEGSVFLSHAGEQKESLVRFAWAELERRGLRAFLDVESLNVGDNSPVVMRHALRMCRAVVVFLTPEYAAKKDPMQELIFALQLQELQQRPVIIPVFYGLTAKDCKLSPKAFLWKFRKTLGNPYFCLRKLQKLLGCPPKFDFYDRVERGETTIKEVMDALREVCKYAGIVNRAGEYQVVQDTAQNCLVKLQTS